MKYELMYWHAFFVRKGLYNKSVHAMDLMRGRGSQIETALTLECWRDLFATLVN
jgi:hypothetical protein